MPWGPTKGPLTKEGWPPFTVGGGPFTEGGKLGGPFKAGAGGPLITGGGGPPPITGLTETEPPFMLGAGGPTGGPTGFTV